MNQPSSKFNEAEAFLMGRFNFERRKTGGPNPFKLQGMRDFLEELGNPQDQLNIVHVAGTKGKGSTASLVSSIFRASGRTCGAYTSPHLFRIEERMRINDVPCAADRFRELVEQIRPIVDRWDEQGRHHLTFFELTTALAILYFATENVDMAVLEVGLGGRLDSTNVVSPVVSIITSISFDHMDQLGPTLSHIAAEKAGIIKPETPVVSGVTKAEPKSVIIDRAADQNAPLFQLDEDFEVDYLGTSTDPASSLVSRIRYRSQDLQLEVPSRLIGAHQARNAAVAIQACERLAQRGISITSQQIEEGLATCGCEARIEVLEMEPLCIVDVAHNQDSIQALVEVLNECYPSRPKTLVFATSSDKDPESMLRSAESTFNEFIFTRFRDNPRAVAPEKLQSLFGSFSSKPSRIAADPAAAFDLANRSAQRDQLICFAGSFFLAAEIKPILQNAMNGVH